MKIYVVRHGETNENISKMMQGNMDTELNDAGRKQAYDLVKKVASCDVDLIFSSPLKRAYDTAKIIAQGKRIVVDERLKSRNHGEFQGISRNEINLKDYWNIKKNIRYEKAESVKDLYDRIDSLLMDIKRYYPDKKVLLVTHSGITRILYYYFNGIPEDGDLTSYKSTNCSFEEYDL